MAKFSASSKAIVALDAEATTIVEGFKTLTEKVPEQDLLKLARLIKAKPNLLIAALPYIEKL